MRLSAPALVLAGLFFAACSGSKSTTNDSGPTTCQSARDCATVDPAQCASPKVCVCSSSVCIPVCQTNADCTGSQICVEGSCSNPGCGGDPDCTSGQVCIGGACSAPTAASAITACAVSPGNADVHQGSTVQLSAVAQDASGNAVPFTGVQWSVTSGPATIDASSGLLTGGAATANGSQAAAVKATISSTVSCTANVTVYGTFSTASSMRVVVIDQDTKAPVSGAWVVLDSNTGAPQTTAADGSVVFASVAAGPHNVHAFAANHDYASFIGVTGNDLVIPIRQYYPIAERAEFDGTITVDDYNNLTEVGQIAHIGFFASGISGSVLDFSLDNFIGKTRNVTVNIGGSQTIPNAPGGLVLGLGSDLYDTGDYTMYADPGQRILWGIGGNLDINTILTIASPIISGGTSSINIGELLPQVLPLLGNLEIGETVGVTVGASGPTPTPVTQSVTLDTPMLMNVAIKAPNLPKYNGDYLDGAIALTGAAAFPLGFTPLGVTAGLAATSDGTASGPKTGAILDPVCTGEITDGGSTTACATNNLPLKMAARNHGLESYPFGIGLVALNFSALTSGTGGALAVSGIINTQSTIAFAGGSSPATVVDFSATPFMQLPGATGNVTYSKGTRTIAVTSDADPSTQIYKFTLQASTHQSWSIYMPPAGASGSTATLVNPVDVNAALVDLQADPVSSSAYVAAIATTGSNTYGTLTGGGNVTVDALGNSLKAFSVQTITVGQ